MLRSIKKMAVFITAFITGSILILNHFGVNDFSQFADKKDALMFGAFVGFMASYMPKKLTGKVIKNVRLR